MPKTSNVPGHVQQWLGQMEAAQHGSADEAEVSPLEGFNDIENEVILVRQTSWSKRGKTSDGEMTDDSQKFERSMFQNKKAHRVACLLASARLLRTFSSDSRSSSCSESDSPAKS
eukprot:3406667-Rhodomonas_salina.1